MRYSNPKFWAAVRRLRKALPANHPVVVRTVPSHPKQSAEIWLMHSNGKRWYLVEIGRQSIVAMKDSLCHEWAHILDWHESSVSAVMRKRMEHTAAWGARYAQCYRVVFESEI